MIVRIAIAWSRLASWVAAAVAAAWLVLAMATGAAAASATRPASQPAATWHADPAKALDEGQRLQKPVLIWAGAQWCPWCLKQKTTLDDPRLQQELRRWVLLYIDTDRSPQRGRQLGINGVPAFRILTPFGAQVAGLDGYQAATSMLPWLQDNYDQAMVSPNLLIDEQAPDVRTLMELIGRFANRDATVREAVIRRLLPYPQAAGRVVTQAFAKGPLAVRLTALELLKAWQAPIEGLDPWVPETLSQQRLAALDDWSPDFERIHAAATQSLPPESLPALDRELDKLAQTANENEAQAIRERLARYGQALLPQVYRRLGKATADRDRQRLTALRYRLLASNRLVMTWPGGLERLASLDAAVRQQAAADLTNRVTPADMRLLTELFSSPDPLVREIALRSLYMMGGQQARQAVVQLLNDPDSNVRAAVLKQLAEKPAGSLVPQITDYLSQETNPDLLVHAVRVLRETGGAAALKALLPLLKHDSWRVRAETAEAIGQCAGGGSRTGELSDDTKAEAYAALIESLKDADGFVISRAVSGLAHANIIVAIKPLAEVAASHPELAVTATEGMTGGSEMQTAAVPYLRKLCSHEAPVVRAAALRHLCQAAGKGAQTELLGGLKDRASEVRQATAGGLLDVLGSLRPDQEEAIPSRFERSSSDGLASTVVQWLAGAASVSAAAPTSNRASATASAPASSPSSAPASMPQVESRYDVWLTAFRQGKGRPDWVNQAVEPLETMLAADDSKERLSAACPLVALGRDEKALPLLLAAVDADPTLRPSVARILPWLPWPRRVEVYERLAGGVSAEQAIQVAHELASVRDERTGELLWRLLGRADITPQMASELADLLRELYMNRRYYSSEELPAPMRKRIVAVAQEKVHDGPTLQRIAALVLLANSSRSDAERLAETIYNDTAAEAGLRQDAFQVLLLTAPKARREALAVAGLDDPRIETRRMALAGLTREAGSMEEVHGVFHVVVMDSPQIMSDSSATAPQAPRGLKAESLRGLLGDTDPKIAAQAGYLLVLLKDPSGMEAVLRYWNSLPKNADDWSNMEAGKIVYRAIAASNDDQYVPALQEIYGLMKSQTWQLRDFYWTIRSMTGPQALELRRRIRSEVGMSSLR